MDSPYKQPVYRRNAPQIAMQTPLTQEAEEPKLLVRLRNKVRLTHYSIRTEQVYVD